MNNFVLQIQTLLKQAGFYMGKLDGIAGQQTLQAVERALVNDVLMPLKPKTMQLSFKGLELIKSFEGFRSKPYLDTVGVPTIGYGNTYYANGRKVSLQDKPLSQQEASDLKQVIINQDFVPTINQLLKEEISQGLITQNMFDALVSLAYNIGLGNLKKSSVIRLLKQGNKQGSADAFLLWDKAGGKTLSGLTQRRKKERLLFLS